LPPTIGPYLLPRIVPEIHRTYPGLRLYVREELPSMLPRALEEGRHDVVMSLLPVRGAELVSQPLFREPLYLAVGPEHSLLQQSVAHRADLEGEDVLALGPGHQLHDVVLALCDELGANLRFDYEGTSLDTLHEMVAMGLGITFLPALYVRTVIARGTSIKTLEIEDRAVYRTVGLIWRRSSARQASYKSLASLLRKLIDREFEELTVLT